jgi:ferredoxin
MSRPTWLVSLIKKTFPGRFLAARATRLPILGMFLDRWLFGGDDLMYLPKDQVIQINRDIDPPGDMVLPSQVVEHFIEKANTRWVMNACLCRDAKKCKDYPIDLGCLFLGDAAAGINPRLGHPVSKEEALEHVRRCREAGLVHLIGRNKLDTVWLGVGPGDRLLTICNCCPCCCLWGILPYVAPRISAKVTRMPGVTVAVTDRCQGCGTCTQGVCFVDAIHLVDGYAVISDTCRGCGQCVDVCPQAAIELSVDHGQFVRESVNRISPLVDVA